MFSSAQLSIGNSSIEGDEFVTPIDHNDEFDVNLIFERSISIYQPICTHMGYHFELELCYTLVSPVN